MLRRVLIGVAASCLVLAAAAGGAWLGRFSLLGWRLGLPAYTHAPGQVLHERVAMRDGVHLATDVSLPRRVEGGSGAWPTILIRDPYDLPDAVTCELFVRFGYACAHQQARGRFESEGEWEPLAAERDDGIDTLGWLVEQPWQDGNIALYGMSYLAAVQWAMADALPPEVKTLVASVFGTDLRGVLYERGMFRHEVWTAWAAAMPGRTMSTENGGAYQSALTHRPHTEVDEVYFGTALPWYQRWIAASDPGHDLWREPAFQSLREMPERVGVPMLMFGGWHDVFVAAQLDSWNRLATRGTSRFVIGPWVHSLRTAGDLDYPGDIGSAGVWERTLGWLGHHLRGDPLEQPVGVLEAYTIGADTWDSYEEWPPATRPLRLHLRSPTAATLCEGAGLADSAPEEAESATWRYDPDNPVPTHGGAGLLAFLLPGFGGAAASAVVQPGLCERPDVLSFVSEPLVEDMSLSGAAEVLLTVSSDAPDTAFTAKLMEVSDDGRAINVRDGIATLAYRAGPERSSTYRPGRRVEVRIALWPIDWRLRAGSRLRLDVSSSNFPAFHAHPNRSEPWAEVADAVPAQQTLHVGAGASSYVELPLRVGHGGP